MTVVVVDGVVEAVRGKEEENKGLSVIKLDIRPVGENDGTIMADVVEGQIFKQDLIISKFSNPVG